MRESVSVGTNNPSEAVKAVAEVAKLIIEPISTIAQTYADDFRLRKLAKTEIEIERLKTRARINSEAEIIRHQINKEQILEKAKELLVGEESKKESSPETRIKIEEDWVFKWASFAKDVSDETVQVLWAKILAGELTNPGTFSLRLLSTISSFRKVDAIAFDLFANYIWEGPQKTFFQLYTKETDELLEKKHNINYGFYSHLQSLGLLDANLQLGVEFTPEKHLSALYGNHCYSFTILKNSSYFRARLLTSVGGELFNLCRQEPDSEYIELISNWALDRGVTPAWSDDKNQDYLDSLPFPDFKLIQTYQ
jgi:hypothetical protein